MPNPPLATEYEATIWTFPYAIPAGGTLTTATLATNAALSFAPTSGDIMVYVYNSGTSTKIVNVGFKTTTATSSSISAFTTSQTITAGAYGKFIVSKDGGAICLSGNAGSTTATIVYWGCSATAAT